jgi:hypothetical protein
VTFDQAVDLIIDGNGVHRQQAVATLASWADEIGSDSHAALMLLGAGLDQQQVDEVLGFL